MFENDKYSLSKDQYVESYKQMLLLRRFEEKCGQLYGMGMISGFCHLYIGQEAAVCATHLIKTPQDSTITSYRDHAHAILSGIDPKHVMAELTGRATGCSKGKGGSMHMFNKEGRFYGGHGIVGAQVPIGTGIAFAELYNNSGGVCYAFLGDGAVNQGQVYEAFNMAALWKLPVIYIIENNEYSMGTSVARSTAQTELYRKGESFGVIGVQGDGMNIDHTYNILKQATDYVRDGNGPIILELKTYRYRGHSMSDPAKYRSKEEVDNYKRRDPLIFLKDIVLAKQYLSEAEIAQIEKNTKNHIAEIVSFALDEQLPSEDQLYTDIYV